MEEPFLFKFTVEIRKRFEGDDTMKDRLQSLQQTALAELDRVETPQQLNDLRVQYLGKKGALTEILRGPTSDDTRNMLIR